MRTFLHVCLLLLVLLSAASAQQIATVTSSAPFSLRGANVNPGQGVPTFPVMAGDAIQAGNALTIVTFQDGSTVTLNPNSEGRVEVLGGRPLFRLLSGRAEYRLQTLTAIGLAELGDIVTPGQLAGVLLIANRRSGGGFWNARNTTLVVVGVSGGTAGLAVGLTRSDDGGPSVSGIR